MERIIKQLLQEAEYIESEGDFSYFSKEGKSFIFTIEMPEAEFSAVHSSSNLNLNERYKEILDKFYAYRELYHQF